MQINYSWKDKSYVSKDLFINVNAIVLVLPNVFIVSYRIANNKGKCNVSLLND